MQFKLHISSPEVEGRLQVSKWLKYQALLDVAEMESLLSFLSPFSIYIVSGPVEHKKYAVNASEFLSYYALYINALKTGQLPDETSLRPYFSSIFSNNSEVIYGMKLANEKVLIKPLKPVLQLQLHHFFASEIDGKFYPMVLSDQSTSWGIQFSYPQLYQDPKTQEITKVTSSPEFPNTSLFLKLVKWMRTNTIPTPFMFQGKRTNSPIRIGKQCLSWIENHPGLISRGIKIISS